MDRQEVYKLIDGERDYQDSRWQSCESKGIHSYSEWILYMNDYLQEATHVCARVADPECREKVGNIMRKLAAMSVAAIEQNGAPPRLTNANTRNQRS